MGSYLTPERLPGTMIHPIPIRFNQRLRYKKVRTTLLGFGRQLIYYQVKFINAHAVPLLAHDLLKLLPPKNLMSTACLVVDLSYPAMQNPLPNASDPPPKSPVAIRLILIWKTRPLQSQSLMVEATMTCQTQTAMMSKSEMKRYA